MSRGPLPAILMALAVVALVLAPADLTSLGVPYAGLKRYGTYILTLWLVTAVAAMGTTLHEPFLQMAFLALPVIPHLKITDKGLVDVDKFELVA